MTGVEQPCYTIINLPTDSEPYNEMQLKMDLGKLTFIIMQSTKLIFYSRKG